jgi:sec-independent protein translocase protein TatB
MFDIGFSEMIVIGVVALIVLGPEKLPRVARTIGALLGRAQRYVNDVKADINREMDLADLKKVKDEVQDAAQSIESSVRDGFNQAQSQVDDLNKTLHDATKLDTPATDVNGLTLTTPDTTTAASTTAHSPQALAQAEADILSNLPPLAEPPVVAESVPVAAVETAVATPKPLMPASAVPHPALHVAPATPTTPGAVAAPTKA